MKNIFVLPTDRPSRLWLYKNFDNLLTGLTVEKSKDIHPQHIYVTSDEEIKEGDWSYDSRGFVEKVDESYDLEVINALGKKIILTTDPQLIADGVQAIDDEFLEWFVKNPDCESIGFVVENYKEDEWVDDDFGGEIYTFEYERYKIIIPQEEPKFEDSIENSLSIMSIANDMFSKKEEPKQDRTCSNNCSVVCGECQILEHKQEPCDNCNNDVCCCTIKKQETIEDGTNKWVFETNADRWSNNDDTAGDNYGSFVAGAKSDAAKNYWFAKFKDENGLKNIK
jgi:hypothetical protein